MSLTAEQKIELGISPEQDVLDPEHPEETTITIRIETNTRLAGVAFLAHSLARFLVEEDYRNVHQVSAQNSNAYKVENGRCVRPGGFLFRDFDKAQRGVRIEILENYGPDVPKNGFYEFQVKKEEK